MNILYQEAVNNRIQYHSKQINKIKNHFFNKYEILQKILGSSFFIRPPNKEPIVWNFRYVDRKPIFIFCCG